MGRPILQLEATEEEILELGRLVRGIKVSVGDRFRATIVLHRLEGMSETEVARTIGCSLGSVCKWSKRFDGYGISGLRDAPGRGRKAVLPTEKISSIVERATRPVRGRVRWSVRSMAREAGVSKSTVQRIWSHNEIKPHRLETFKISNDPNFEEKFWDVIGLYLDPPERLWCSVATRRVSAKRWSAHNALFLCGRVTNSPRPMITSATAPSRSLQL